MGSNAGEGASGKDSIVAKLKSVAAFRDFDEGTFADLAQGVKFIRLENESELFRAGEPAEACYIVSYGGVKLLKPSVQGKDVVLCFCRAGDVMAAAVMNSSLLTYPLSAVAMEDSGLLMIPRKVYVENWMPKPHVARAIQVNIMSRMMEFHSDKVVATASVPHKVANFLLRTLDAQPSGYGSTINIRLTRRDIAARVGTTVETVIRILSAWTQRGWISTEDQRITIHDRAALEEAFRDGKV
jgi:CRP/FNR family transcriptional regulator